MAAKILTGSIISRRASGAGEGGTRVTARVSSRSSRGSAAGRSTPADHRDLVQMVEHAGDAHVCGQTRVVFQSHSRGLQNVHGRVIIPTDHPGSPPSRPAALWPAGGAVYIFVVKFSRI